MYNKHKSEDDSRQIPQARQDGPSHTIPFTCPDCGAYLFLQLAWFAPVTGETLRFGESKKGVNLEDGPRGK